MGRRVGGIPDVELERAFLPDPGVPIPVVPSERNQPCLVVGEHRFRARIPAVPASEPGMVRPFDVWLPRVRLLAQQHGARRRWKARFGHGLEGAGRSVVGAAAGDRGGGENSDKYVGSAHQHGAWDQPTTERISALTRTLIVNLESSVRSPFDVSSEQPAGGTGCTRSRTEK